MTKDKVLREIQKILNTADPSRMELKFGCEVENKWASERNPIRIRTMYNKDKMSGVALNSRGQKVRMGNQNDIETFHDGTKSQIILGQKPDLQGVLRCLGNQYVVGGDGIIYGDRDEEYGFAELSDDLEYNLSLPFEDQKESVLTAILELLKK